MRTYYNSYAIDRGANTFNTVQVKTSMRSIHGVILWINIVAVHVQFFIVDPLILLLLATIIFFIVDKSLLSHVTGASRRPGPPILP